MEIRTRILDAAQKVYAQHGFRGATTRLIANEAGVNEVTLFRTFGSKDALLQEVFRAQAELFPVPALGEPGDDFADELTAWCGAALESMRSNSSLLRKAIGEIEERPGMALSACEGPSCVGQMLHTYVQQLQQAGKASPDADVDTAVSMLMSTLWGDAMCRELMPEHFPPADVAAAAYVRTILRAVGAL